MRRFLSLLILLLVAVPFQPATARDRGPLVLAAASLQESLTAAADAWAARGHDRPVLSFAASSALARSGRACRHVPVGR
jgi:molybdate transport system substrate-binding protein